MATQELEEGHLFDKFFNMGKAPLRCEEGEALDGIVDFLFEELEFFLINLSTANAVGNKVYRVKIFFFFYYYYFIYTCIYIIFYIFDAQALC